MSELYNKDYTNAVIHLSEVLVRPDQQYKEDATWYLSLAHLKAGNMVEAKNMLSKIATWDEIPDARIQKKNIALQAKALLMSLK